MLGILPDLLDIVNILKSNFTLKGILKQWLRILFIQHFKAVLLVILILLILLGICLVARKQKNKKQKIKTMKNLS